MPCPPPGDHPDPGIEPTTLTSPALAGRFFPMPPGKPLVEVREGESRNDNGEAGRGFVAMVRR